VVAVILYKLIKSNLTQTILTATEKVVVFV